MKKIPLLLLLFIGNLYLFIIPCVQGSVTGKPSYASEKPISVPVIFVPGIISTPGVFGSTFTPDGQVIYFAKYDSLKDKSAIMKSYYMNNIWSMPEIAEFSGQYSEGDPFISPDGTKIFFWSTRPIDGKSMSEGNPNIWMAEKTEHGFGVPVYIGNKLGVLVAGAPTVSTNGTLYFFTDHQNGSGNDIFSSAVSNNEYSYGIKLKIPVNSKENEFDSYIAPDESYLIISRGLPDSGSDLFISFNKNGKWSNPKNLGDKINSPGYEYCPVVSPDGNYLFFTSDRSGSTLIYQVEWKDLLNSMKKANTAPYFKKNLTNKSFNAGQEFIFSLNRDIFVDDDEGDILKFTAVADF